MEQSDATNFRMRPVLTADAARALVRCAIEAADRMSIAITVAAVDDSGALKALERMDGAPLVSLRTAQDKAYAAAAIGMAPDDFYAAIESDAAAVAAFATRPGLALIAGGMPLLVDGVVAGGLGVAGAMTAAEDRAIAERAIEAVTAEAG
jgi:uncharacterized protein GlcG (DUF336 family)